MELIHAFSVSLQAVWADSGFIAFTIGNAIMILVGLVLLYLAIVKEFEPLLLGPIAFGCILANFPNTGFLEEPGLMQAIHYGIANEIFPPLIFLGIGAMTDFGPLIARPQTLLLGAAAQIGVFIALIGAMLLGFTEQEAGAIGIIGGADGPTAIYMTIQLAPHLLGAIAVAAYSYMSLVPLIQPPIMKLLTTRREREVQMEQLRPVTKFERLAFPVVSAILISLLLPPIASLLGMMMLGNLMRESGVMDRLSDTAQNSLCNIVTIFLATGTGLTMTADSFLRAAQGFSWLAHHCARAYRFHLWHGGRCRLRKTHVPCQRLENQPADWIGWCQCCTNGSARQPNRRNESKAGQLPFDACHGTERSGCHRHGSGSRNLHGHFRCEISAA